jgi:anion-transporting  ArsA/GET3 family ATPase
VKGVAGELDAMMLDMKRTFDEIVVTHAEPDKAEQILANPFYQALSSSFAGTQEYMAMEKLGQLKASGVYDLIVVDTPPTRSALDFLDAPDRLTTFLDGRLIKILIAPAKAGGKAYLKVVSVGFNVFTSAITRIIGASVLQDVSQFVAALETMFGGFRERAQATYDLLKDPGTAFVVVATPERDALREASYFVERLATEQMPLAGLVVNRVHRSAAAGLTAPRSRAASEGLEPTSLTAGVLRLHAERLELSAREAHLQERFSSAHPHVAVVEVAAQPGDVHDLDGLRAAEQLLPGPYVGTPAQQRAALALGHAPPDAELDAVVEGVGKALHPHGAAHADGLGAVLRRTGHEQVVGVRLDAGGVCRPVVDGLLGAHGQSVPRSTSAAGRRARTEQ